MLADMVRDTPRWLRCRKQREDSLNTTRVQGSLVDVAGNHCRRVLAKRPV